MPNTPSHASILNPRSLLTDEPITVTFRNRRSCADILARDGPNPTMMRSVTAALMLFIATALVSGCSTTPTAIERTKAMSPASDLTIAANAFPHKSFLLDVEDHAFYEVGAMYPALFADDRDLVDAMAHAPTGADISKASQNVYVTFAPPSHRGAPWKPHRIGRFAPRAHASRMKTFRAYWASDATMGYIKYNFSFDSLTRNDCQTLERYASDETHRFAVPVLLDLKIVGGDAKVVKVRPVAKRHAALHDDCVSAIGPVRW